MDVVVGGEDAARQFPGSEKMTEICTSVAAADGTAALRIDGALILSIARVFDEHAALAGVQTSMAGGARGKNAIHHVDAQRDVISDLFGTANTHEVTRAAFRKQRGDFGGHFASHLVGAPRRPAAHGVATKIEIEKVACAPAAPGRAGFGLPE